MRSDIGPKGPSFQSNIYVYSPLR